MGANSSWAKGKLQMKGKRSPPYFETTEINDSALAIPFHKCMFSILKILTYFLSP